MFTVLLPVLVLLAVVWRVMKPAERLRMLQAIAAAVQRLRTYGSNELEPFNTALRARTPLAIVTPVLVAINVLVFAGMLFGHGALADPSTRVAWGASVGPRTTNGEWWRLLTMAFVHSSFVALVINMTALFQIGVVLERLVGRVAFALNYCVAIILAALTTVSAYPTAVCAGASGAVLGTYGLLTAAIAGGRLHRSTFTVPLVAVARFAPMAALVVLYSLASGSGFRGDLVGFAVGLAFGAIAARDVSESTPAARLLAKAVAAVMVIAVPAAFLLRGITDVAPEIQRLVEIEKRTSTTYDAALEKFKKGRIRPAGLADAIDRGIVPELQAADVRIRNLHGVPPQDQPKVDDAKEYLRLRTEGWRLKSQGIRESSAPLSAWAGDTEAVTFRVRAEARHRSNTLIMANAENSAHAALETLKRLSAPAPPDSPR